MNCWEFFKCGREPEGDSVDEYGICTCAVETRLDGVHGGKNGGRACWAIPDTLCAKRLGGLGAGRANCLLCQFYDKVLEEEICHRNSERFIFTSELLRRLGSSAIEYERLGESPLLVPRPSTDGDG